MVRTWVHITFVSFGLALAACANAIGAEKTIDNLKAAFSGETTAFSKYTQYAKVADKEGQAYAAVLFRAAARAEGYHARNHKEVLERLGVTVEASNYTGKVGKTVDNLYDALKGEIYEKDGMYPDMIKTAKKEGVADAARSMEYALNAEGQHAQLYKQAAEQLKAGKKPPKVSFYVCPTCGATFPKKAPASCPVCATPRLSFIPVK